MTNFLDISLLTFLLAIISYIFGWYLIATIFLAYPVFIIIFHEICCRLGLQGKMQWTPGNMERMIFHHPQFHPMLNVKGFQQHMLAIHAYLKSANAGEELAEGRYAVPEGLRVKVKRNKNSKSYVSIGKIEE